MKRDWLYGFPISGTSWEGQMKWLEEAMAADPSASEITELEAEQFMAASYVIRFMDGSMAHKLRLALGVPAADKSPHGHQRAVIRMLKKWRMPSQRKLMLFLVPRTSMGRFLDAQEHPELWTDEFFVTAFWENQNVCMLAQMKRFLDPDVNVPEWLASLEPHMQRHYRFFVGVARLTLRQLVYTKAASPQTAEQQAAPAQALAEELREKEAESGALRQTVRHLQQDRKALREKARRQERQRQQMLSQAQGEVAAARRALNDRRQAMHRELAERTRRHQAELERYRRELVDAQREFLRALGGRRGNLLQGRRVQVEGGDPKENRLVVESLGGTWATAEPDLRLHGTAGPAALELGLHGAALDGLVLRCDGLRRRKGERPPIAASAFQAYRDGAPVFEQHRVICCGSAATSLQAEYSAVAMALSWLLAARPAPGSRVEVWSDCRTLTDALAGRRPPEGSRGCAQLDRKVQRLLQALAKARCTVEIKPVKRDRVDAEDRLCDLAYRDAIWYHRPAADGQRVPLSTFLRSLPPAR